ncbi:hypothetical protein T01_13362 [Trichinella spiralis]|uniref:Uncharacterized protein n=1 Tax=Trichinella spiralis TaxID=6334 RepID=A0A0V1BJX2_TRISP|nr:hypothetical protein T01_13362 [Trichinella spiralis]
MNNILCSNRKITCAADEKELKIAKVEYESNSWRAEDAEYLPDWLVCKMFKDHCETISRKISSSSDG